jgi:tRNA1Val (adenine37-N6)-methyltransferase
MKVSTDACIQGAWTPADDTVKRILDIGTGTGLLSLMLAQRTDAIIDAVELDEAAAQQAKENTESSPWAERIQIIQADATDYTAGEPYDMIFCNPPFFNNSLLSDKAARNMARHTHSLSYSQLFNAIQRNLSLTGYASIMLPPPEHELWNNLLNENEWCVFQKLIVKSKEDSVPVRIISLCKKGSINKLKEETLIMRQTDDSYTEQFIALMQPYYLYL